MVIDTTWPVWGHKVSWLQNLHDDPLARNGHKLSGTINVFVVEQFSPMIVALSYLFIYLFIYVLIRSFVCLFGLGFFFFHLFIYQFIHLVMRLHF